MILTLFWSRQTRIAAVVVVMLIVPYIYWVVANQTARPVKKPRTGEIIAAPYPALYAAIASFFTPALYSVVLSVYKPYKFDWRVLSTTGLTDSATPFESLAGSSWLISFNVVVSGGRVFTPALYSVVLSVYKPYKFDWRVFLRIELADQAKGLTDSATPFESLAGSSWLISFNVVVSGGRGWAFAKHQQRPGADWRQGRKESYKAGFVPKLRGNQPRCSALVDYRQLV
jgi:hypothetical protein